MRRRAPRDGGATGPRDVQCTNAVFDNVAFGAGEVGSGKESVQSQGLNPETWAKVTQALGIPLSVTGKNPFFDRQAWVRGELVGKGSNVETWPQISSKFECRNPKDDLQRAGQRRDGGRANAGVMQKCHVSRVAPGDITHPTCHFPSLTYRGSIRLICFFIAARVRPCAQSCAVLLCWPEPSCFVVSMLNLPSLSLAMSTRMCAFPIRVK